MQDRVHRCIDPRIKRLTDETGLIITPVTARDIAATFDTTDEQARRLQQCLKAFPAEVTDT
ncbi:MAG: hypothetical protein HKN42_18300 [Granulosicoccus sp.]|nr:hypothetical protein [Granulosicoccus sp.]